MIATAESYESPFMPPNRRGVFVLPILLVLLLVAIVIRGGSNNVIKHVGSSGTNLFVNADEAFEVVARIDDWPVWFTAATKIVREEDGRYRVTLISENQAVDYDLEVDFDNQRVTGFLLTDYPYYTASIEISVIDTDRDGMSLVMIRQEESSSPPFWHVTYELPARRLLNANQVLMELRERLTPDSAQVG